MPLDCLRESCNGTPYLLHSVFCASFLSFVCFENVCMLYSESVMGARDGWFARGSVSTYLRRDLAGFR